MPPFRSSSRAQLDAEGHAQFVHRCWHPCWRLCQEHPLAVGITLTALSVTRRLCLSHLISVTFSVTLTAPSHSRLCHMTAVRQRLAEWESHIPVRQGLFTKQCGSIKMFPCCTAIVIIGLFTGGFRAKSHGAQGLFLARFGASYRVLGSDLVGHVQCKRPPHCPIPPAHVEGFTGSSRYTDRTQM